MSKPSFYISCAIDTYSGYGARSRDIVKSIIELDKYDVKILAQRWGDTPGGFINDHKDWKFIASHLIASITTKPDIWMQITIPSEFQAVGKYNIGCTAGIESTGCDPTWIEGLNRMDLNLVSSEHSKKVFSEISFEKKNKLVSTPTLSKLEKPIEVLFEGADTNIFKQLSTITIIRKS